MRFDQAERITAECWAHADIDDSGMAGGGFAWQPHARGVDAVRWRDAKRRWTQIRRGKSEQTSSAVASGDLSIESKRMTEVLRGLLDRALLHQLHDSICGHLHVRVRQRDCLSV